MVVQREVGNTSLAAIHVWSQSCPQTRPQTGVQGAFGKPLGTVAGVHFGQVIVSLCAKLSDKGHVTEALHGAKFKFLAARRCLSQGSGASPEVMPRNLEIRQLRSSLSLMAVGSNISSISVPWTPGGPCTPEGFRRVLDPTKSYAVVNLTSLLGGKFVFVMRFYWPLRAVLELLSSAYPGVSTSQAAGKGSVCPGPGQRFLF